MKVLCLGDINSFFSLQDALTGNGLPPIQRTARDKGESNPQSSCSCSQFDWILIKNNASIAVRQKQFEEILREMDFSDTFTISIDNKSYSYDEEIARSDNNIEEPVIFEYHSPCSIVK